MGYLDVCIMYFFFFVYSVSIEQYLADIVGGENGNSGLRWPAASDLNTRLRRLIAGYQRVVKKQQLKKAAAEKVGPNTAPM